MFRNWLSTRPAVSGHSRSRRVPARRRPALLLENLEDRTVPTVFDFTGGTTDWYTAANWTDESNPANHAVPGAADTAVLNNSTLEADLNTTDATVGALQITGGGGILKLASANLTVLGNFTQQAGFVEYGTSSLTLTIEGNFNRTAGAFVNSPTGTVALAGQPSVTVTDTSGNPLPNLKITNDNFTGVFVTPGSTLTVNNLSLLGVGANNSTLTLQGSATLTVNGNFTDNGKLVLNMPTPGTATPVTVAGTLTASSTAVFDLTVGSPANGNVYKFVQYGTLVDNGATYVTRGNGAFTATVDKTSPFIAVKLGTGGAGDTYDWNGSVSSDWFTAANWTDVTNPGNVAVPGATDTAVILGGPNATVLNSNATVGKLQVSGGFITINANLTDNGNYSQDSGFVAFGADSNLLTVDGNFSHPGGVFFVAHGTVVLAGAGAQTVTDTSGHSLPNLHVTNTSGAGVTVASGSSLTVTGATGLTLDASANLTLAGTATLAVNGNFTDNGKLFLNVPAPGNATAPVTVSGTLAVSATSFFDLTMGSENTGNVYLFITYGSVTGAGSVLAGNYAYHPDNFAETPSFGSTQFTVTLGLSHT